MIEAKSISYDLRNSNVLFQPKWQKVTYGKHIFKIMQNEIKLCTEIDKFISIKIMGPKYQCAMCNALS